MGPASCLTRSGALKHAQSLGDFRPFSVERSQSALQGRNDIFRFSDRMASISVEAFCPRSAEVRPESNVFIFTEMCPTAGNETTTQVNQVGQRNEAQGSPPQPPDRGLPSTMPRSTTAGVSRSFQWQEEAPLFASESLEIITLLERYRAIVFV